MLVPELPRRGCLPGAVAAVDSLLHRSEGVKGEWQWCGLRPATFQACSAHCALSHTGGGLLPRLGLEGGLNAFGAGRLCKSSSATLLSLLCLAVPIAHIMVVWSHVVESCSFCMECVYVSRSSSRAITWCSLRQFPTPPIKKTIAPL